MGFHSRVTLLDAFAHVVVGNFPGVGPRLTKHVVRLGQRSSQLGADGGDSNPRH